MNHADVEAVLRTAELGRHASEEAHGAPAAFARHADAWEWSVDLDRECRLVAGLPSEEVHVRVQKRSGQMAQFVNPQQDIATLVHRLVDAACAPLRAEVQSLRATVAQLLGRSPAKPQLDQRQIARLEEVFTVALREHVFSLVAKYDVAELLLQAAKQIRERFPDSELAVYPIDDRLSIIITTGLDVDEAMGRLERIEREWWVDARGDRLNLSLTLEFR